MSASIRSRLQRVGFALHTLPTRASRNRRALHHVPTSFAALAFGTLTLMATATPTAYAATVGTNTVYTAASPAAPAVATVHAVPIAQLPLYKPVAPGQEVDHYTQGPNGSTIVVRTFSGAAAAQIAATQYQNFSYTYNFDSNLQGRTMQTTDGTFCNVVTSINPSGQPYSNLYLQLWSNSGGEVSPQVYVSQPNTGWCWQGNTAYTNYHYTYVHSVGYYGYYISGSGQSYG